MKDGIILVDKPTGMSSFGVVARIRRILSEKSVVEGGPKKVKVGHTGTLDPFASGLMILVVGKECKNAGSYSKLGKTYEAVFTLGQTSSTGDPEGELTVVSDRQPSMEEIRSALLDFTGPIMQQPPIFSAIKINGRRAYSLAREGAALEMPLRSVTVYGLELLEYSYPYVTVRAAVSSGTYIRSLASDIGSHLGIGAYCSVLRRVTVGDWSVKDAQTLEQFGITD